MGGASSREIGMSQSNSLQDSRGSVQDSRSSLRESHGVTGRQFQRQERQRHLGTCFRAFGVTFGIRGAADDVAERLLAALPPGTAPAPRGPVDRLYSVSTAADGTLQLHADSRFLGQVLHPDALAEILERDLDALVATHAPHLVFIEAGVVAYKGRAIVVPGNDWRGTTTLVAALLRQGAAYYSDTWAVMDEQGRVYPYPRRLLLRDPDGTSARRSPEEIGARRGNGGVPVGIFVLSRYEAGVAWEPQVVAHDRIARALLPHVPCSSTRPEFASRALLTAAQSSIALAGPRGEANEVAADLLSRLN